eukprot:Skav232012  [mRNA]  locus=scaffold719:893450:894726:+ [translate_table: standard]
MQTNGGRSVGHQPAISGLCSAPGQVRSVQPVVDDAPVDAIMLQAQPDGRQTPTIAATTGGVIRVFLTPCNEL